MLAFLAMRWWWIDWPTASAQAPPALPLSPSLFEQYGPGGLVGVMAMAISWTAVQHYKDLHRQEREEKLAALSELRDLNKIARESMTPAITQSTAALTEATTAIAEAMRVLRKDDHR